MPFNHCILCRPLLSPSVFPIIKVFSNESALRIRWPKYWSFNFSLVFPMNIQGWYPLGLTGLISLQSEGLTLESLLQHHSSKASILQRSAFFIVQLSHLYMTTGKTSSFDYPNLCQEGDGKFADKSPDFSFQSEGTWQLPSVTDGSRHIPQHIPKIVP